MLVIDLQHPLSLYRLPSQAEMKLDKDLTDVTEVAESRSCYDMLISFAPQLDGDDYLQYPCSSFLHPGHQPEVISQTYLPV